MHFQAGLVPATASKDEFAQALRSVGEPIFGQTIKDISGGNLLAQLFEITEKFHYANLNTASIASKNMVVVEGVARKLYPETNIWEVSKPTLENWLKDTKKGQKIPLMKHYQHQVKYLKEFPTYRILWTEQIEL